ncbi:MAG: DDE-type integrase/transposase/recombinase [Myxococcales bacterium]|nr:DDE-type integrase/transposase/recombinase [Myxococcales bacterium]
MRLHAEAFRFFGGVPRVVVPDNLKAAVVRAAFGADDRHLLGLNRSYRELARFFGFKVDPAPVRAPEKKGKVESAVRYVKRNFMATCEQEEPGASERGAVRPGCCARAGTRRHPPPAKSQRWRTLRARRARLLPLPRSRSRPCAGSPPQCTPTATSSSRAGSTPRPGASSAVVWVRATAVAVELYADDTRVATHERRGPGGGSCSTNEHHLPEGRRDLRFREGELLARPRQPPRRRRRPLRPRRLPRATTSGGQQAARRPGHRHPPRRASQPIGPAPPSCAPTPSATSPTRASSASCATPSISSPCPPSSRPAHGGLRSAALRPSSAEELLARFTETTGRPH